MTLRQRTAQALMAGAAALVTASPAMAATDKGDTAFLMLSATVLVLLMTIPGLALFYCGLVRTKNVRRHADAGVLSSSASSACSGCSTATA